MKAQIDFELLAKQKQALVDIVMTNETLSEDQASALDGIIGMLDVMLDEHDEEQQKHPTEVYKFPRRCDITGKGMWEGYCFGDGQDYAIDKAGATTLAMRYGYDTLEEAFEDNAYYFTAWEELDEDEWYESLSEDGSNAYRRSLFGRWMEA